VLLPPAVVLYVQLAPSSASSLRRYWSTNLLNVSLFLSLLLMTIPFPGLMLNRGIVKFGDLVFNIRIGTLSIFSVITFVSFVVLAAQTYDLQKRYSVHSDPHIEGHYSADLQKKATRWRSERNWWISALTFTIYW